MSLQTPTTKEINDSIVAQMETSLNQSIPLLPKSFIRVTAKVLAAVYIMLYKYGGYIHEQIFVRSAQNKQTIVNGEPLNPLVEWGRQVGVGDPLASVNAELQVTATVVNQTGSIPSGTQLTGVKNGVTYLSIGDVILDAPTVTINVRAVSDQQGGDGSGEIGNLQQGDVVSFANPLSNVNRDTVVDLIVTEGSEGESTEDYRARIAAQFTRRAQGGTLADYKIWAESAPTIKTGYPYRSATPGQIDVYCESSVSPNGIPTSTELDQAQSAIDAQRPANDLVNTLAITRSTFDVDVIGLVVDNASSVQSQISAAVGQYFADREPFIEGLSVLPRLDRITQNEVRGTVADIVSANGGLYSDVVVKLGVVSQEIYTLQQGEKAKAGSVVFL